MDKNLIKIYTFFIMTFVVFITLFPNIFLNMNNAVNYFKIKTQLMFINKSDYGITMKNELGNIIIMMDDGWKTQYDVGFKYMNNLNMVGSIAVITNAVNDINYVNTGNLYEMDDNGWDLLNHTADHINLKKSDYEAQDKNIKAGEKWLTKHGFINSQKILIYPYGYYNDDTLKVLRNLKIVSGRSVDDGMNPQYTSNFYDIKIKNVISNTKPKVVFNWIDQAIEEKLTLILLFHKLEPVTDNSLMQYDDKDFRKIIDYLDTVKNDVNIITYSDWIKSSLFFN